MIKEYKKWFFYNWFNKNGVEKTGFDCKLKLKIKPFFEFNKKSCCFLKWVELINCI